MSLWSSQFLHTENQHHATGTAAVIATLIAQGCTLGRRKGEVEGGNSVAVLRDYSCE
jgi:hypothetical protein